MKFLLPIMMLCLAFPAYAQDTGEEDELPTVGSGKLGRFTIDEAEGFARRIMDGEIIDRDVFREQGDQLFYEYLIRRPDDSIFEVEIDATSGELYEIEVERLGTNPVIPFTTLPPETLEVLAISHMKEKTRKIMPIQVKKKVMTVYNRRLVYAFDLKQSSKEHRIYVDAVDGKILSNERID